MICLWRNQLDDYTLEASSEQGNYPASYLQDPRLVISWRTTGVSDETIKIDAGAGETITATSIAIAGHNLTAAATIKIQANATDAWGDPSIDETVTWDADIITDLFTNSTGYRFWRFYFDDDANGDGYLEIGRLFLGTRLQMPKIEPGVDIPYQDTSVVSTSISGESYGDEGVIIRAPAFRFPHLTDTERGNILSMWREVKKVKPIFLLIWEDSLDVEGAIYCRINMDELAFAKDAQPGIGWALEIEFTEVF
jgi:hypothetical protein